MSATKAQTVKPSELADDDHIIAVMGATGTGKSTFIDIVTEQNGETVGHSLKSYTQDIRSVRYKRKGIPFVFVDTPGFDDTKRSDADILKMIAKWLKTTYKHNKTLAGILYLHRISDPRMSGTPHRNLRMFGQLCGQAAMNAVVFVTTMWPDQTTGHTFQTAVARQQELEARFWAPYGAKAARFHARTYDNAWEVISLAAQDKDPHPLLLQEEMVEHHQLLSQTSAGRALFAELQKIIEKQRSLMQSLKGRAGGQNDPSTVAAIEAELARTEKTWRETLDAAQGLKIPFWAILRGLIWGGRPSGKAIDFGPEK